ncbi:MAG: hypothetical protein IKU48_04725 [Clostridia bacterium]|nr:hypothetical protein [Clostridia bacterium]
MKNVRENKREVKLYNVMFPIWLLFIFPITWLFVIPANFIIDSLVLLLGMYVLRIKEKVELYKKTILWIFIFGFVADILGGILLLITQFVELDGFFYEYLTAPIAQNPFDNVYSLAYTCFAVVVSAVLIYVFNRFVSFRKVYSKKIKRILSLLLAIITAPYLFLVPTSSLYGGQTENFTNHIAWDDYVKAEIYIYDEPEVNITETDNNEHFNYGLVSVLRYSVNTAKKDKVELPKAWKYKVVFQMQDIEGKRLEPIFIYEIEDSIYFEWKNKTYRITDENKEKIYGEIEEHLNPQPSDEIGI